MRWHAEALAPLGAGWGEGGAVAGVDEVGRGPLAGPVVACAVVLAEGFELPGLADSKALSPHRREQLAGRIAAQALGWSLGSATAQEIDRLNILQATLLAMQRAVAGLRIAPDRVVVDGNRVPDLPMPAAAVVGGDARLAPIAAASVLAKVHRDRWCAALHARHPAYGFDVHKGYPTAAHRAALQRLGPCDEHRLSFAPVRAARAGGGGRP